LPGNLSWQYIPAKRSDGGALLHLSIYFTMAFDSQKLKLIIIAVLALFAALYLGIAAATAQFETIAWVVGGITLAVCVLLGSRIWLLIPLFGAVSLSLQIPGQPSTLLLAQLLFLGFTGMLFLMRRLPFHFKFGWLEFWMLMLVVMVIQVYMRNPAGIGLLGGDKVGGKAYIIFALSALTGGLLGSLRVPVKDLAKILPLTLLGWAIHFTLAVVGLFMPTIGMWYGGAYATEQDAFQQEAVDDKRAAQRDILNPVGARVMVWISAYISPLKACFSPRWVWIILFAFLVTGMSGFRSAVGLMGLTALVGIWYRGGFISVLISSIAGVFALAAVSVTNSIVPLPASIQRAFSFLPGTWDDYYKQTTQNSTEWRVEIWKEVLLTDRWISNKWLGVGLGFTKEELLMQQTIGTRKGRFGVSGFDAHRETILANGDYHSGPVQTIRTIGYIGLAVLLIAMIALAVEAHRLIIRTRGTEWHPLALLVGIPIIVAPVFFVLVFGTFADGASSLFIGYGMIRLIKNNLPLPGYGYSKSRNPQIQYSSPNIHKNTPH
jgi:hypothetical protein